MEEANWGLHRGLLGGGPAAAACDVLANLSGCCLLILPDDFIRSVGKIQRQQMRHKSLCSPNNFDLGSDRTSRISHYDPTLSHASAFLDSERMVCLADFPLAQGLFSFYPFINKSVILKNYR